MSIETMRVGAVNLSSHSRHLVRKMYVKTQIIIMHEQIAGIGFMLYYSSARDPAVILSVFLSRMSLPNENRGVFIYGVLTV